MTDPVIAPERMWMESHGYGHIVEQSSAMDVPCRRIEWRYLGDES